VYDILTKNPYPLYSKLIKTNSGRHLTAPGSTWLTNSYIRPSTSAIAIIFFIIILYFFQYNFSNHKFFLSGWVVPDGVSINEAALLVVQGEVDLYDLVAGSGFGSYTIYYPVKWLGVFAYFIINMCFILIIGHRLKFIYLMLFPYFLIAIALPSKDIIILFLSVIFINNLLQNRWILAFAISLISYIFRDGAMVVMMYCLGSFYIIQCGLIKRRTFLVLSLMCGWIFISFFLERFMVFEIVARNYAAYLQNSAYKLEISSLSSYPIRILGNLTNLAFRPSITDTDGGISVLGFAYFVSGVSLLASVIYSIKSFCYSKNLMTVNLSFVFLISVIVISLNPHIQSRYLLPFSVVLISRFIQTENLKSILKIYIIEVSNDTAALADLAVTRYQLGLFIFTKTTRK
jgi:hypothetical protein